MCVDGLQQGLAGRARMLLKPIGSEKNLIGKCGSAEDLRYQSIRIQGDRSGQSLPLCRVNGSLARSNWSRSLALTVEDRLRMVRSKRPGESIMKSINSCCYLLDHFSLQGARLVVLR
jgi:hypothetical protein